MTLSTKVSALALVLGAAFSSSAFAVNNVWLSSTPWASATTAQYAGWNTFDGGLASDSLSWSAAGYKDSQADFGTGGTVKENTSSSFITSGGNIYSFALPTTFTATLTGTTSGFFDVYLRIATIGTVSAVDATLNGISGVRTLAYSASAGEVMGGESTDQEVYWKWSSVAGSALYTFNFGASGSSMSLDQLQLATVAVAAVPEPSTYGMMAIGLGILGFSARRTRKQKPFA